MAADDKNKSNQAIDEVQTYSVGDIAAILKIGRNKAYELCQGEEFRVVRIGTSIRIPKASFTAWLLGENTERST